MNAKARADFARQAAAAIRDAQAAKAAAIATNATERQRLDTLANEIGEAEARLDAEDLSAIQILAVRREQLARLSAKHTAESSERLAAADKQLFDALNGEKLAPLFKAAHAALLEQIADALKPFYQSRDRGLQTARESDSAVPLGRLTYIAGNGIALPLGETLAALDGIENGSPPWIFS